MKTSFNLFFTNKVTQIRANIGISDVVNDQTFDIPSSVANMSTFHEVNEAHILIFTIKIVQS
jgi:hypothetical protein